mgnify:CR=1 FL=1
MEEQERRELLVKKVAEEDEELFVDEEEEEELEEEFEDEFYDEALDEMGDDEEGDATVEDSRLEIRLRRTVPEESPPINDAEEEIVGRWWDEYKKMNGTEEIRQHLEDFLRDHPKLVPNLELHTEMLFELGGNYVREGRHAEYIGLLLKMRSQFPEAYLRSFGYYDRDIIAQDRKSVV